MFFVGSLWFCISLPNMFARLHFVFFVFVMFSLLDVLICVSFRFLYISLPHCILNCLHDLQTVKPKNHHIFLCCRIDPSLLWGSQSGLKFGYKFRFHQGGSFLKRLAAIDPNHRAWRIKQAAQTWALPGNDHRPLRMEVYSSLVDANF